MAKFEDGIIFTNSEKAEIDLETKLDSIEQSIESIEQTVEDVQDGTIAATNAKNVSSTIAGKAITSIFEDNGTTVKNATNASTANVANSVAQVGRLTKLWSGTWDGKTSLSLTIDGSTEDYTQLMILAQPFDAENAHYFVSPWCLDA